MWRERIISGKQTNIISLPGLAFSGIDGNKVVGASGFVPQWEGRMIAWALLSPKIPKMAWVQIARKTKLEMVKHLANGTRRIEATVPVGFDQGIRYAELLGFKREALMKSYQPDGSDAYLFACVR
jgi:hypothetical protein